MLFNYEGTSADQEELFKALTERALVGTHSSWEWVRTLAECCVLYQAKRGLLKIVELYENVSAAVYREYCSQVLAGTAEFEMILAVKQFQVCKEFYIKEADLIKDMLDEYDAYVGSGHFLDQVVFGKTRETWHLWDHRKEDAFGNYKQ